MKKTIYTLLAFTFFVSAKVHAQLPNPRTLDSLALVQLYNSTDGPNWTNKTNWLSGQPMSTWFGVRLTGNRVTALVLPGNNLAGSFSPAVGVLSSLKKIDLSYNALTSNIANLNALLTGPLQLDSLNLSHNNFDGNAPIALNTLPFVHYIDLSGNQFTGRLPSLTQSSVIREIYLTNNGFTGNIPASYGSFSSLQTLSIDSNALTGGLANIAASTSLQKLNLSSNQFAGTIPAALGNISTLQALWLNNNGFTGSIPAQLGNLSLLQILGLNHNALTGTIPSGFSNLGALTRLNLRDNMIEGPLPSFLMSLTNLDYLGLINNSFTFAGLEPLIGQVTTLEYQKQKPVVLMYNPNSGKLSVAVGGTPSNNTYTWYMGGNMVASKSGDSTYLPAASGIYYVEVTNTVATALTLRSKNKMVTVSVPVASIFPNPAKNITTLSFNLEGNSIVKISDRNGRMMAIKSVSNASGASQLKLDVTSYPTGVYFVNIRNGKQVQTLQLNKQ